MKNSLGARMKRYEDVSHHALTRRTPVIIRVDGKSFHTYTEKLERPFDRTLIMAMVTAATRVMNNIQGCKLAYVASDEASFLLTDWENLETQPWFDYNLQKIVSIAASLMTAYFNTEIKTLNDLYLASFDIPAFKPLASAMFDARAFNIPREEVSNYFLWRAKDWERNSLQMVARNEFSHKQLQGIDCDTIKTMLLSQNIDWENFREDEKYGTFVTKTGDGIFIKPNFVDINTFVEKIML